MNRPKRNDHTWYAEAHFVDGSHGAEWFLTEDEAIDRVRAWDRDPIGMLRASVLQLRWVLR